MEYERQKRSLLSHTDFGDRSRGVSSWMAAIGGECGEIVRARQHFGAALEDVPIDLSGQMPGPAGFEGWENRGVPDAVGINFPLGRETGVKGGRGARASHYPDFFGKMRVERREPLDCLKAAWADVRMGALGARVDARIGPARAVNPRPFSANGLKGAFEMILHGTPSPLALPAEERAAIVRDDQF